jgi:hypothetical protein
MMQVGHEKSSSLIQTLMSISIQSAEAVRMGSPAQDGDHEAERQRILEEGGRGEGEGGAELRPMVPELAHCYSPPCLPATGLV